MTVDTKHYDKLDYKGLRIDPYLVASIWEVGKKDPSGCLFHILKNIARFGEKEGNSIAREIAGIRATLDRFEQIMKDKELDTVPTYTNDE